MKSCDQFDRFLQEKLPKSDFRHHCESCVECRQALELDHRLLDLAAGLRRPHQAPAAVVWHRVAERTIGAAHGSAAAAKSEEGEAQTAPRQPSADTGPKPPAQDPKLADSGDELTPPGLSSVHPGDSPAASGSKSANTRRQPDGSVADWTGMLSAVRSQPLWRIAALLFLALAGLLYYRQQQPLPVKGLLAEKALQRVEAAEADYLSAIAGLEAAVTPQLTALPPDLASLYRARLEAVDAQILRCREALAVNPANAHIRRYLLAALHDKQETLRSIKAAAVAA